MDGGWSSWDGHRLRWHSERAYTTLCIDGIVFQRFAAAGDAECSFDYSPTGNAEMAVSLRDGHDEIAPVWRIRFGESASIGADRWTGQPATMHAITRASAPRGVDRPVVVVVPVFNAAALTQRCVESALRWTSAPARMVLIDDASADSDVVPMLKRYESRAGITIIRNARNLGYTRSSNLGIDAAGDADVVLLNSDTQVAPRWLDRFRAIANGDDTIGTVTAVSDNAGAFSVPELEQFCPIPSAWTLEQAQRALLQRTACPHPQLPTGNGFCMYIKRAMLDAIGALDADAFPFGYGEENDLCQRAEHAGFRHVIAGDVLVAHARSASFGDARRAALGAQGMAVLRQRYPDYEEKIGATLFSFDRRVLDYRVRRIYADCDGFHPAQPRALAVGARDGTAIAGFETLSDAIEDPDWLVDQAVELICVFEEKQLTRWRPIGAAAAVPVIAGAPTSGWNSLSAFGSF